MKTLNGFEDRSRSQKPQDFDPKTITETQLKFFNLFWSNKACYNVFLLSKEEFLESTSIGLDDNPLVFTTNKIIITNTEKDEDFREIIKYRIQNADIELEKSLDEKIDLFKRILEDFFTQHYKKSLDNFLTDLEQDPFKFIVPLFRLFSSDKVREKTIVELLKEYDFIPKHIDDFKQIENHLIKIIKPSKKSLLTNEKNIKLFFEGLKFVKEMYENHSYKKLHSTNQVLVNTLFSSDDYTSRIKMFNLLYEARILNSTNDDAFIECCNCEPNTFKGIIRLKISPNKLNEFHCPVCSKEPIYFVPYELHTDIYSLLKTQDGLLQCALIQYLNSKKIVFETNISFLNNIEIDCLFSLEHTTFVIESKMYKLNTTEGKLKSKIREHFGKLVEDIQRIKTIPNYNENIIQPILLTNINDSVLLKELESELNSSNKTDFKIMNLELFRHHFQC